MELANALLALGGDRDHTVPKYNITPAEAAVLMQIHGSDAVFDIEPVGSVERSHNDERNRLMGEYTARDEDNRPVVLVVYPGTAALVHTDFASLGLDASLYKAVARVVPVAAKPKRGKKAAEPAAPPPVAPPAPENDATHLFDDEDDGAGPDLFEDGDEAEAEDAGVMG